MKRRTAIKNIGLGMGISVSTGTFLSMLASCKSEPSIAVTDEGDAPWKPSFLTDEAHLAFVENLAEAIFPKTETPGAKEAGVINFIDLTVDRIYEPEDKMRFKKGLETCITTIETEQGGKFSDLDAQKITAFLENHIGSNADKEASQARKKMLAEKEPPTDEAGQKEYYLYNFLSAVKYLTVGGYFGSELVATEHLVYNPVPGPYEACIDYDGGNNYYL